MNGEKQRRAGEQRNRHEVLLQAVGDLLEEQRVDREHRAVGHQKGVAIRRRCLDRGRGDAAVSARAILHHHRLADAILQSQADETRDRVGHASRRIGHDEANALRGIRRLGGRWP